MITKDREVDEKYSGSPDEIPDSETAQKKLLCMIDKEIKTWKGMIKEFDKKEKMELNAEVDSLFIPSKEALDKIIRYETAIEKQFYRALHELIRLQAFRKGQNIQVPLAVDLDISTDS